MAIKATIYKASLEISDLDRQLYSDHEITMARHPSETDERMMIRLLAFALNVPAKQDRGMLEFGKDMWDPDEPALWQKDLTGQIEHWIEIGQPEEKRMLRVSARAGRVSVYSFSSSTPVWWKGVAEPLARARNLTVWQIPAVQSQALGAMAERTMRLHVTLQEGSVWLSGGERSVEVVPVKLGP
jgi:uncharacterized protein YaeQ